MKKRISEDAYYNRLVQLADVNGSLKKSNGISLGTLIDYKRADDGIAYGIVKENHNYYIKKGGLKKDPDVSDFVYIGGLENKNKYCYKTLAEADKNRTMIINTINETYSLRIDKPKLNEDSAGEEIAKAEKKLGDAEIAASAETTTNDNTDSLENNMGDDIANDQPDGESSDSGVDDTENPDETSDDEIETDSEDNLDDISEDEPTKEIEKLIGKVTNKIRNTELTDTQVKSYVNSFLSSFKDKFTEIDIVDRKKMADKILKVVPKEKIEDLTKDTENTKEEELSEEKCNECGDFVNFAKSRGYDSAESITECSVDEVANLVGGYATAYNDGMNDGDFDNVALVIKIKTPEILNTLKNDYGHVDYANKLEPIVNKMNESDDDDIEKLNELFGGLKSAIKKTTEPIKQGVQSVGNKLKQGVDAVNKFGQEVKQAYHAGEVKSEIERLEKVANDLGKQLAALNTRLQKAGKEPVNVNSILTTIKNQLGSKGSVSINDKIQEDEVNNVETQPDVKIAQDSDVIGVITPEKSSNIETKLNELYAKINDIQKRISESKKEKPSAGLSKTKKSEVVKAAKAGKDIGKKGKNFEKIAKKATDKYGDEETGKKVAAAVMWKNIKREDVEKEKTISESEQKLRKYIRRRLEEKMGLKKPMINESIKSEKLKKLDSMIDNEFSLFESLLKENNVNEIFGLSYEEKFRKLKPENVKEVDSIFRNVFSHELTVYGSYKIAYKKTTPERKYEILTKYFNNGSKGGIVVEYKGDGQLQYAEKSPIKQGGSLSGLGFNAGY